MYSVLAIDVGKTGAWAYRDSVGIESGPFNFTDLVSYEKAVKALVREMKPDILVTGYPTRFYNAIVRHSKYQAIVELVCQNTGCEYMEINDSQAKKSVLGKGKAEKEEIMKHFNVTSPDEADASLFATHVYNLCLKK